MKWDKNTKEELSYIAAFIALLFGLALCAFGFYVDPTGVIHDSVLWLLGQCLFYSGAVFGISGYIKQQINNFNKYKQEKKNDLDNKE